ncbi:hypothetical protein MA16_Dca017445 [Dendrobium catenatum]|uniref:Uncharacterized protein n=1 Tax=Dendrobium catenatum TaxID=906689 RepID=A0A2I0WZI0_9ASPA|nr:hypothetical protein MA16_Dca017445 [Dendrobium catenatum]
MRGICSVLLDTTRYLLGIARYICSVLARYARYLLEIGSKNGIPLAVEITFTNGEDIARLKQHAGPDACLDLEIKDSRGEEWRVAEKIINLMFVKGQELLPRNRYATLAGSDDHRGNPVDRKLRSLIGGKNGIPLRLYSWSFDFSPSTTFPFHRIASNEV